MRYLELAELYQKLEKTTKRLEKTHIIAEFLKDIPNAQAARDYVKTFALEHIEELLCANRRYSQKFKNTQALRKLPS